MRETVDEKLNSKNYIATSNTAREELLHKILFLKDTIENNEGYKLLYQIQKKGR